MVIKSVCPSLEILSLRIEMTRFKVNLLGTLTQRNFVETFKLRDKENP